MGNSAGKPTAGAVASLADAKPTLLQRSEYVTGACQARDQGGHGRQLHAEFNALRAQVAINDGNLEEAERLEKLALDELPLALAWFYSLIHDEVLYCKGDLSQYLSLMQQTEQMVRHHDV